MLNSAYQDTQGIFWAGEVCDPVEDDHYGYTIGSVLVTDFVTPNWFAHQHVQKVIDFKGYCYTAFEILSGGYAQKFDPQTGWQQVTEAKAKRSKRGIAPIGSRRERRIRQAKIWHQSEVEWASVTNRHVMEACGL